MFRRRILGRKGNAGYEDVHNSCVVRFLDETEPLTVTFQKDTTGQYLIDHVCTTLDLAERDYFGLRYVDSERQRHWLDPKRSAYRQLKNVQPMVLCFRVKFYPSEPLKLKEEITRYYLFLQLSRDFYHGRLLCSQSEAVQLSALLIQAELGEHSVCRGSVDEAEGVYVGRVKNLPKQIQKQEMKVAEMHQTFSGMCPGEAEEKFIEMSSQLDTYGVDPHPFKDASGSATYLGVTHLGVVTFQGNKRTHLFHWPQITKLDYDGKHFIVQASPTEDKENTEPVSAKKKKQSYSFKCPSSTACKHLWKSAVQQQYFFTLQSSTAAPKVKGGGGLFRRASKYRFSGHCESEVLLESAGITRQPPSFKRSTSNQFLQTFDKIGTGSLPSSFRSTEAKENNCDVVLEPPRSESLDHGMSVILERLEEGKPEPPPVQVFDANYEPTLSPDTEELPAFPGTTEEEPAIPEDDSGVDLSANSDVSLSSAANAPLTELDYSELATADLDAQIKELQMELEKCKNTPPSHSPVVAAAVEETAPQKDPESGANHVENSQATTPNGIAHSASDRIVLDEPDGNVAFPISWSSIALVILAGLLLAIVFLLVLFETELNFPLLSGLRRWPEIDSFRSRFYRPAKSAIGRVFRWW